MRALFLSLLLLCFACGEGVSPLVPVPDATVAVPEVVTLEDRMSGVNTPLLHIVPAETRGVIQARLVQSQTWYTLLDLRAASGTVLARLDTKDSKTALTLERFDVRLADLPVFDTGLVLTELHFHLASPDAPAVIWYGNRSEAVASFPVTMTVSGAVRGPRGYTAPFETLTFDNVPLELSLTLDANAKVVARFRTQGDQAPSWSWANLLETGAARFEGTAAEVLSSEPSLY